MTEKSPSHNYFDKQTNINQVKQLLIPYPGDGGRGTGEGAERKYGDLRKRILSYIIIAPFLKTYQWIHACMFFGRGWGGGFRSINIVKKFLCIYVQYVVYTCILIHDRLCNIFDTGAIEFYSLLTFSH